MLFYLIFYSFVSVNINKRRTERQYQFLDIQYTSQ